MTPIEYRDDEVVAAVKTWIDKVIIGLNFCPFAKKEIERNTVRYAIFPASLANDALSLLLDELTLLDKQPDIQTTLLIFPAGFSDFESYLDMLEMANSLLAQGGYSGMYQLASFHPDYCFEGEDYTDPANYTNRSPYPILHILRESSIDAVLKRYPDPHKIPENNIAKARELGTTVLQALVK
ncbi:DUF1415 domain-containing protein [Paraglaciecola arctica]|uniref:DUF1415 domain-containing protein n=1 Tax=Paraglaciecola arctica TaxID=1128911 RepID=UPI001C06AC45|nr:DUF1415 domain-containing protein [Paraglaciecola arctica]MBU3003721.1 DUF1415 domain-containing protein [Paraglaciecola arctica]